MHVRIVIHTILTSGGIESIVYTICICAVSSSRNAKIWSEPLVQHVQTKIVPERTAHWAIEKYGVYNLRSGVTTNMSEGFNTVIKQFLTWKEVPVDILVHSLQELLSYYLDEIQRATCGLGQYRLKKEFSHYQ